MSQTWAGSLVEMKANIVSGFALNWGINVLILPVLFDPEHPMLSAFKIGCVFTIVSMLRQLLIRRHMDKIKRFQVAEPAALNAVLDALNAEPAPATCSQVPVESLGRDYAACLVCGQPLPHPLAVCVAPEHLRPRA